MDDLDKLFDDDDDKTEILSKADEEIRLDDVVHSSGNIDDLDKEYEADVEENRPHFSLKNHKQLLITALVALAAVLIAGFALLHNRMTDNVVNAEADSVYNNMHARMLTGKDVIEYAAGDKAAVDTEDLIEVKDRDAYDITIDPQTIDASVIGKTEFRVRLRRENDAGRTISRTFSFNVRVEDTKKPEISLGSDHVSVDFQQAFDPMANIVSVSDPVDGALAYAETQPEKIRKKSEKNGPVYTDGWYTIDASTVDVYTPGDYTVTVHACDRNGNVTEASYTVTVNPAEPTEYYYEQTDNGNNDAGNDAGGDAPAPVQPAEPEQPEATEEPSNDPGNEHTGEGPAPEEDDDHKPAENTEEPSADDSGQTGGDITDGGGHAGAGEETSEEDN